MKHKWDILWRVVWWACAGLWAVALCVVVHYARRALVADVFVVPSESMQPTLLPGDRVKVDKTIFGARLYTSLDFTDVVKLVDPATGCERKERRGLDLTTRREEHGTAV